MRPLSLLSIASCKRHNSVSIIYELNALLQLLHFTLLLTCASSVSSSYLIISLGQLVTRHLGRTDPSSSPVSWFFSFALHFSSSFGRFFKSLHSAPTQPANSATWTVCKVLRLFPLPLSISTALSSSRTFVLASVWCRLRAALGATSALLARSNESLQMQLISCVSSAVILYRVMWYSRLHLFALSLVSPDFCSA